MNKKIKYFLVTFGLMFVIFLTYIVITQYAEENKLIKQGNELVVKINIYKQEKGSLPNSLLDLGIEEKEDEPLYYEKKDIDNFIIWFGTSLGESKTYHSDSKKWEDYDR